MKKYLFVLIFTAALFSIISCDDNSSDNNNNNPLIEVNPGEEVEVNVETNFDGADTIRSIELSRLPFSFLRWSEIQAEIGDTPEGAAALFILALRVYQQYDFEGVKALVSSIFSDNLLQSSSDESYNGYSLTKGDWNLITSKIGGTSRLPYAYMKGATPANGYIPDKDPFTIQIYYDKNNSDISSGSVRLYVMTKGAQSDRPMTIKLDTDNLWRVSNFSSVFTGLM